MLVCIMRHAPCCRVARGAVGDRSIRTPTSKVTPSASQGQYEAEEDGLVRVPRQQTVHQLATGAHDLAGQAHEGVDKRLELDAQQPPLLGLALLLTAARPF